jgi:hypothetical protein
MAVGMFASGWLIYRSLSVWGEEDPEYGFGADMVLAAVVVVVWAVLVRKLFDPPASALAAATQSSHEIPLIVWPLGRQWRFWTATAVPICGLLAPLIVGLAIQSMEQLERGSGDGVGTTLFILGLICAGSLRGFFFSRRYARQSLVVARTIPVPLLADAAFEILLRMSVDSALRLEFDDGTRRTLYASSSHSGDVARGASIIQAWCLTPSTFTAVA